MIALVSMIIANVGLTQLLTVSIPVLVAIYPVAVALVLVTFLKKYFRQPAFAFGLTLTVALVFGAFDGLKVAGLNLEFLNFLPLFDLGLAWLFPTVVALVICLCIPAGKASVAVTE